MLIRNARDDELALLLDLERAAGASFREIGMAEIADDDPGSPAELAGYQRAGRAWVATDDTDRPIAYLIAEPVDGNLHIEQVSVHPDWAHRGIGRALLEHAAAVAAETGAAALTLTTFRDVPWNGPYYRRLGFRYLTEAEESPGLRRIRRHEAEHGLDRWPRACMRREI
ncbi:GNAT family N-acetyltransferase [Plantactinospora siamensis]|uniref:GNAT family N-acetyltransferase n=1 Tax=Plantactinospora siamensis TaxID=555372 RepID=A0ABV6P0M8_9ACTN